MAKSKIRSIFVCQNCGSQRPKWEGKCSECGAWNSLVEEMTAPSSSTTSGVGKSRSWTDSSLGSQVVSLDQKIEATQYDRLSTGIGELDRVLGGGLVMGSFILLGGDPGIGKSTLLLQMAGGIAKNLKSGNVLYISAEESIGQTGLRAQRLGVKNSNVQMASEANLETLLELAKKHQPKVLIVDSIQTIYLGELASAPGSVSQVRECASQLMAFAKNTGTIVFLIGHVTKDGNIAGPKVLEHMVDCVLSFEGDVSHQFRLLRAQKNRFGATFELGVFQMEQMGLKEVANPSEMFLEERGRKLIGSAVFSAMEGTRPILCEVQALTTSTPMPMPRRTSLGFDVQRVHLLIAVLNKHLSFNLMSADVFINVVGGLSLSEPAADLAVTAALMSTELNQEIDSTTCFFGEIGLTGEVRAVSFADQRLREAQKLGFKNFVIPASNKKHLTDLPKAILEKIFWVHEVYELKKLFASKK
jgi:DNA repair protein RadA/Sms